MHNRKVQFFLLLFLVCLFECPSLAFGQSFSNSEVLQTISDYYELGIENYTIQTGYSNSYTTYSDFLSQLDNYKYFMVEYLVTSNSSYIYIYYGDQMWFDSNLNRVSVKNARSGQFIIYENFQGGKTQKSVLRNIVSYSNSQFNLDTSTQKYYIFNCATSTAYNNYYAKQGGFSGDEIFNIVNNNGQSIINTISITFSPTYSRTTSVYINGVYQPLYVNYYNRPPQFWRIGTLENFDVNENLSPYFSQVTNNGSFKILDFNSYSAYKTWSSVSQAIYVDGMSLRYNVVYSFNLVDDINVSTYYFLFQPKQNEGVVENDSGDYVFSGDAFTPGPTSEDYLSILLNNDFDYSGDYLGFYEDDPIDYSGDYTPFYMDLVLKVVDVFVSSGDVEIELPVYNFEGQVDHTIKVNSASARWDIPIISELLSIFWTISFGIFALKFFISYINLLLVGKVIVAAKKVDSFVNVL